LHGGQYSLTKAIFQYPFIIWLTNWFNMAVFFFMKTIKIGSFEAKTHFSQLLQEVEKGKSFDILRRGKPVARLGGIGFAENLARGRAALDYFHDLRSGAAVSKSEILSWIREGRH